MTATNLPPQTTINDSAAGTKLFFDNYGQIALEFSANDVSAATAFFQKRGFETDAALVVATVVLKQAKLDNIPVHQLLDTLGKAKDLNLSQLVGEIMNNNRTPTSTLGFRTENVKVYQTRNIAA